MIQDKIRDMLNSKDPEMKELGRMLQKEENVKKRLGLDQLSKLVVTNPNIIVAGSVALYLHGIKLKRFYESVNDIDIILPHYQKFENPDKEIVINVTKKVSTSGSEFEYYATTHFNNIDIRIDPYQQYELVTQDDIVYKVCPIEDIIAAKIKYIPNNIKHKDDLLEMLGLKKEDIKYTYIGS